jgi:flagellar protein FliS
MENAAASLGVYKRVEVETASQGKLIVMLFNGAIQRAEEARRRLLTNDRQGVHNNLLRAQEIIAELRSALNMEAGEIARNLDRVYEYCHHLLIQANVKKDAGPIEECVSHLTGLRDTWQELFDEIREDRTAQPVPAANPHGNSIINIQG